MRNTDDSATTAQRFGRLVKNAAQRKGYDLTPGSGGRKDLAEAIGMDPSSVSRMIDGKTLPRPHQFERIAKAVGLDTMDLLVESEILSARASGDTSATGVRSDRTITPEEAADAWGITNPMVRGILLSSISHAMRMQAEAEDADRGGATARG